LPTIQLPPPAAGRNTSVFTSLEQRNTTRDIRARSLSMQMLSNLLFSCGPRAAWIGREVYLKSPEGPPLQPATRS